MLVVDASVAVKWVLPETDSHLALKLRHDARPLIAPSLVVEEIGSVLWRRVRLGEIDRRQALDALRISTSMFAVIEAAAGLGESALAAAIDLDHAVCDCFYIALALRQSAPLITADARLAALATRAGVLVEALQ
jgi:predicted nucleic acid-binding protein